MINIPFVKYQGAGNDFIIIDQRDSHLKSQELSTETIEQLCDRRFGIGADGLMLLAEHVDYDFEMIYYNSDGQISSMCGNGGRCIVAYANRLKRVGEETTFMAIDGVHRAKIIKPDWIELEMQPVKDLQPLLNGYFLDTGSPHYVEQVAQLEDVDVFKEGRRYRQDDCFAPGGTNVNFVTGNHKGLEIATYERGVEAETLACGTGVTAAALVAVHKSGITGAFEVPVIAKGGRLSVRGHYDGVIFSDIWLCGPATFVFEGAIGFYNE
jgi:diaminopimelate epimerase